MGSWTKEQQISHLRLLSGSWCEGKDRLGNPRTGQLVAMSWADDGDVTAYLSPYKSPGGTVRFSALEPGADRIPLVPQGDCYSCNYVTAETVRVVEPETSVAYDIKVSSDFVGDADDIAASIDSKLRGAERRTMFTREQLAKAVGEGVRRMKVRAQVGREKGTPSTMRYTCTDPTAPIDPKVQALNHCLSFLSGLQLGSHSISTQREAKQVIHEIMGSLKPGERIK